MLHEHNEHKSTSSKHHTNTAAHKHHTKYTTQTRPGKGLKSLIALFFLLYLLLSPEERVLQLGPFVCQTGVGLVVKVTAVESYGPAFKPRWMLN